MKNVVIIYNSKTGTTKNYSEEMGKYLRRSNNDVVVLPIEEYTNNVLNNADYLLLGCWTSGLMFFLQHPDKNWVNFTKKLPSSIKPKIALFTTYKILTGSMFRKMQMQINANAGSPLVSFKSRNGILTESDKKGLDSLVLS